MTEHDDILTPEDYATNTLPIETTEATVDVTPRDNLSEESDSHINDWPVVAAWFGPVILISAGVAWIQRSRN